MAARPDALRALRLLGAVALVGVVYWLSLRAAPHFRPEILYVIPVLLVAWHDGPAWATGFAAATSLLRVLVGIDQMPPPPPLSPLSPLAGTPPIAPFLNELAYLAVVGVGIVGLSQLRRTQARLEVLATRDPLTNVRNARAFANELAQELGRNRRYGRPLALVYLDLDDFKAVNETHGHATGDAVLRLVADAMQGAVRQADIVGRLGGDEFGVLMPETEGNVAHAAAARLAMGIRTAFRGTPSVTASIGVVSVTGTEAGTDELLRKADQAMDEAKRAGKDRVVQVAL